MKYKTLKIAEFRTNLKEHLEQIRQGKHFMIGDVLLGNVIDYAKCTNSVQDNKTSCKPKKEVCTNNVQTPNKAQEIIDNHNPGQDRINAEILQNGFITNYTGKEIIKLKLEGKIPLELNEYINESTGELEKWECDSCGHSKFEIRMSKAGNKLCLNCADIRSFELMKKLQAQTFDCQTEGDMINKQTKSDQKVKAQIKPVKKKKNKSI